jgi:hypothetical protein
MGLEIMLVRDSPKSLNLASLGASEKMHVGRD